MKKIFILFLFLGSLLASTNNNDFNFTEKEQAWINKNIPITYVYDIDWAPFEWKNEVNRHTGIISDILSIIAEKSSLKFEAIHTNNWSTAVLLAENNKVDMYSAIPYSASRAKYMNFTSNDIFEYNACFVKHSDDQTSYKNLQEELIDKTIGIVRSSSLGNSIKKKYPQAKYIELDKTEDGFKKLQSSQIDLFIINSATADYMINIKGYNNLEIAMKIDHVFKLKVAISKNMPDELLSIIDKTLADIDKSKIDKIYNKWMSPPDTVEKIDWEIIIYIILIASIIVLFLIYRQYLLYKSNKHLEELGRELEKKVYERTIELEISNKKLLQEVKAKEIATQQLIQQSRMAQMGEMISMIAHQWRQPLTSISAITLTLSLNDYKKEYIQEKLDLILQLVQHLSSTIDDFRNFYQPNKEAVHTTTDLVVKNTLSLIQCTLTNIDVETINDNDTKEQIEVYENELSQVLLNILNNAYDNFIEKKIENPQIQVTTTSNSIYICDNGGGIDQNIIEKIFDPYFSTKNKLNGTGLGLYMSKTIVEVHHNGKLSAVNKDDGVCFIIQL